MFVVRPIELTPGLARNQTLTGRVCLLESGTVGKAGRAFDYVDLHLVAEEGLSGTLYIEAWFEQARRLTEVANEGKILKLTNLSIKALGELAKWQCTPLHIYGQVLATTRLEEVADSDQYQANVHTILLSDLPLHRHVLHSVNVAAVFLEEQQTMSTKATAPAFNLIMAHKRQIVRVALWKDHAANVDVAKLATSKKGQAIILTSLRVIKSKASTSELATSKRTRVLHAPEAMAAIVQGRHVSRKEWRRYKALEAEVAWRDVRTKDELVRTRAWHAAYIRQDKEWQDANAELRDAAVVARHRAVALDRQLREDSLEQAAAGTQAAMQAIVQAVQDLARRFDAGPVVGTPLEVMSALANLSDAMQVLDKALVLQAEGAGRPVLTAEGAGRLRTRLARLVAMAAREAGTPARVAAAPTRVAEATAPERQPLATATAAPDAPLRTPPRTTATPFSPYVCWPGIPCTCPACRSAE